MMFKEKVELIDQAKKRFPSGTIEPAGNNVSLGQCFSLYELAEDSWTFTFTYNIGTNTHMQMIDVSAERAKEIQELL